MDKYITFEEAIRKGIIERDDKVNPHKLYSENKKVTLLPEETGCEETQIFTREENLDFFYAKNRKGIPTLWGNTTETELFLRGEIGAEVGVQAINRACISYSNLKMGMSAQATTEKDLLIFHDIVEIIRRLSCAWLGSSCVNTNTDYTSFGVRYVDTPARIGNYPLFDSRGYVGLGSLGVAPAISLYLPSKILVDIDESKESGTWILVPNENE